MKNRLLNAFVLAFFISVPLRAELGHRIGGQVGGLYLVMGFSGTASALYQMVFHRNFALEFDGNYNWGAFALGQGPAHSGGLDISLQAMLYNFGQSNFSKGVGLSIGSGLHYLVDFNQNKYHIKKDNLYLPGKGNFLVIPLRVDIFYTHLFDNNWFIKTGFKGYLAQYSYKLNEPKTSSHRADKIVPSLYFGVGYSF